MKRKKSSRIERILVAIAYFVCFSMLVLGDGIARTKCINDSHPLWTFVFLLLIVATILVAILFISKWEDCYDDF